MVAGEITTKAILDVPKLARQVIADIGFTDAKMGFDAKTCGILNVIQTQSPDIAMGVDTGGAGDQGLMFGYACDETTELMPLPIQLAHHLVKQLSDIRRTGKLTYLRPDGKSQVSVEYVDGQPKRIDAVVISTQHDDDVTTEQLRADVKKFIIDPIVPSKMVDSGTKYHINPTGRFVIGGPHGDTGLTGRKIIVDTYGGMGRQGSDEGRPLGLLYGALRGQEPRRGRSRQALRSAAGLRHRRGGTGIGDGEYVRHRHAL
jgi:S-adenosylmethionine synthetase